MTTSNDHDGHVESESTSTTVLSTFLPVETKTCFPVADGRELTLHRGTIPCRVSFLKIPEKTHHYADEWDVLLASLQVEDQQGQTFRLEREISANSFLELVRMSRSSPPAEPRPVLMGVHCAHDHRVHIPTVAIEGERLVAFAYWAKHLCLDIDLLTHRVGEWDQLVIRAHPTLGASLSGKDSPTVTVATNWAAKIVVWPGLVTGAYGPLGEQPMFLPTEDRREPQPLVTVT